MPNMDSTGPQGKGPLTGRQMGKCQDAQPLERGLGQGLGRGADYARGRANACGRGLGRGMRCRF